MRRGVDSAHRKHTMVMAGRHAGSRARLMFIPVCLLLFPAAGQGQRSDTTVIRPGAPRHAGISTLVEERTLGAGSDAVEFQFTNVFVFTAKDGGVFVVDMHDPGTGASFGTTVRKYDREGRFVHSFGRSGQGPGEYVGGVGDVKELPDGRVLLSDSRGILVYSPTGEPLGLWRAQQQPHQLWSRILVDPAGLVYMYGERPRISDRTAAPGPPRQDLLYRFRFDGTLLDTVAPPHAAFPDPQRIGRAQVVLLPRHLWAWSPLGYFVTAVSTTYAIDLRKAPRGSDTGGAPAGWNQTDNVVSIRRTVPPVPLQQAESDDWRRSVTMFNRTVRGGNPDWRWSGPDLPRVKPAVRHLIVAGGGRIWVRVSQEARVDPSVVIQTGPPQRGQSPRLDAYYRWVEPLVFDVFEPEGVYVGRVRFPEGAGRVFYSESVHVAIDGDTVWSVEKDRDDVPIIKQYRVRWSG
jgi:hypothetical protein